MSPQHFSLLGLDESPPLLVVCPTLALCGAVVPALLSVSSPTLPSPPPTTPHGALCTPPVACRLLSLVVGCSSGNKKRTCILRGCMQQRMKSNLPLSLPLKVGRAHGAPTVAGPSMDRRPGGCKGKQHQRPGAAARDPMSQIRD